MRRWHGSRSAGQRNACSPLCGFESSFSSCEADETFVETVEPSSQRHGRIARRISGHEHELDLIGNIRRHSLQSHGAHDRAAPSHRDDRVGQHGTSSNLFPRGSRFCQNRPDWGAAGRTSSIDPILAAAIQTCSMRHHCDSPDQHRQTGCAKAFDNEHGIDDAGPQQWPSFETAPRGRRRNSGDESLPAVLTMSVAGCSASPVIPDHRCKHLRGENRTCSPSHSVAARQNEARLRVVAGFATAVVSHYSIMLRRVATRRRIAAELGSSLGLGAFLVAV